MKAAGFIYKKHKYDEPLSAFAFNFNVRPYTWATSGRWRPSP